MAQWFESSVGFIYFEYTENPQKSSKEKAQCQCVMYPQSVWIHVRSAVPSVHM